MAGWLFCTRKLGLGGAKWVAVSRIGPSMPAPTTSESGTSDEGDGGTSAPVALIVVTALVSALLCFCVVVLVLRNNRRRQLSLMSGDTSGGDGTNPGPAILWKSLEGHEEDDGGNEEAGRRRSAQREEQLVVMAGENLPTFLAHPVGAPPSAAWSNIHIQCPPLQL